MRRRRALEPPFAAPPIALDQKAEQSKSDPWSERLPDGRTVNELLMQTLKRGQAPRSQVPSMETSREVEAPEGIELSTGGETRPSIVGGSLERDPLKREAARIRTMLQHPTRDISPTGEAGVAKPMGRVKGALLGALFGLAQGDRNTSLAERLAAGGAGAAVGGFKPRAVQDWRRRMEAEDAQGQLAQQTKLSAGQAQLENLRAETQSRMADLMLDPETGQMVKRPKQREPKIVERVDGVYEISEAHPDGRKIGNIPPEVRAKGRGSVHYENREDGVYAIYADDDGQIKSQKVEGVPGKPSQTTEEAAQNKTKREAKLNESSSYYKKADEAESNAKSLDEHIRKLEEGMKTIPEFAMSTTMMDAEGNPVQVPNPGREGHQKEIANLRKRQQDYRDEANKLREKGDVARSEGESIPETTATAQSGRKWSASRWAKANPSGDVAAATAAAKAAGYQVVE